MAFVLPANGPSTVFDVTDIKDAAFDDDFGTRIVVEPLGGTRKNGLDHEEFGMFSERHSGRNLLTLTITSFVEEIGLGEYMHALTFSFSCPTEFEFLEINRLLEPNLSFELFRKAF
jgi:hypothetical protein